MNHTICPKCKCAVSFIEGIAGLGVCPSCRKIILPPSPSAIADAQTPKDLPEPPVREGITSDPLSAAQADESPTPDARRYLDIRSGNSLRRRLSISPWPRRLKRGGLGLASLGVTALLAWWLGGGSAWEVIGGGSAVLMAIITYSILHASVFGPKGEKSESGLLLSVFLWALYGWVAIGVWYWVGSLQIPGTIHIDNASTRDLQIDLDGQPWRSSSPGQLQMASLRQGYHQITVRPHGGGKTLEELNVCVEGRGVYILNLLKAETYYRGTVQYGGFALFGQKEQPREVKEGWIDVTTIDFLFQNPPQSISVKVTKGMESLGETIGERRTYVTRRAPPPAKP